MTRGSGIRAFRGSAAFTQIRSSTDAEEQLGRRQGAATAAASAAGVLVTLVAGGEALGCAFAWLWLENTRVCLL